MKIIKLAILFVFIGTIISFSSTPTAIEEPNKTNEAIEKTEVNEPNVSENPDEKPEIPEKFEMKEVYPVKEYSQKSPTDTLKTFAKATINNDADGVKSTLSEGSLKMIRESAEVQGVSVDAILLAKNENTLTEVPEMKNEKITGDTAIVEVKNRVTGGFDKMPLIKENGEWKLALDKFMEETMQKLTEDMNEAPSQ